MEFQLDGRLTYWVILKDRAVSVSWLFCSF